MLERKPSHRTRRGRCHVLWNLRGWIRNHDLRTDVRSTLDAHARALDRCRRDCIVGGWDSVRGKGNPPERSAAVEILSETEFPVVRCTRDIVDAATPQSLGA